ncbi:MAG: hypothetical protein E7644_07480 [Ruminococcaceae bacterium]|nr:hypothetical protein [Oscillospiraceae bacterium]
MVSFRPPFSKGGAVEGAEPSSPSAEGEMLSAFLFDNFFFAPRVSKKKWAGSLMSPCGDDIKSGNKLLMLKLDTSSVSRQAAATFPHWGRLKLVRFAKIK